MLANVLLHGRRGSAIPASSVAAMIAGVPGITEAVEDYISKKIQKHRAAMGLPRVTAVDLMADGSVAVEFEVT